MRLTRVFAAAAAAVSLAAAAGCGPDAPMSQPGAVPTELHGRQVDVDACALLRPAQLSAVLGRDLVPVGLEYAASRLPTLTCQLGVRFAEPVVGVGIAVGPVASQVFTQAYGDTAGGDPVQVSKLKRPAFLRTEQDNSTLHVFVHGSILSLSLQLDPAHPVSRAQTVELARLAVARFPRRAVLAAPPSGGPCAEIGRGALTSAIGTAPGLSSRLWSANGSLMCSWGAQPGSADVTVLNSPQRVADYLRSMDETVYDEVEGLKVPAGVRLMSRSDSAGDVLVFDRRRSLAIITVVPAAGFADEDTATTAGELRLVASVVRLLV